ncbi:MAG: SpoIIE family protein phosphatase [Clostridiaceae bacterium]|nr:serine/threonine-protein phosphatase [Clostridiales bacterium]MDD6877476.1 SpoIIE family protein phosphatase [Clostridiaceae bacterium]MDY3287063.1 SpoIIE family protein phosphatase [Eubacteriales bacterium]MDY5016092.1 SpoIIE family protein phosphatase [Eubacteriales bacterium]
MNNLCADIGYNSLTKFGEQLCGDHIDIVERESDDSRIIVLADGLGSGVKANILSTLTARIISTMMSEGMRIEECVKTVAATLPVCKVRGVAYSTFTILRLVASDEAEIIEYDNPPVILIRNGKNCELPRIEQNIEGKTIYSSHIKLCENDIFIAMSDGCIHAGVGMELNFGWERRDIIQFMETFYDVGFTAKTLNTILLDECSRLYGGKPGDDTTALTVRIRRREPMNLLIGPPSNRDDCDKMMSLFFSKAGKHIVCGGTTSTIAAKFLGKPLIPHLDFVDPDVPPTAEIEGVDLVTEGVITFNKVLQYAKDYIKDNESYTEWGYKKDGASQIARMLFEEATDINFFVGRAANPAHQNPALPISFNIKMQLVDELAEALRSMGKRIKVSYF